MMPDQTHTQASRKIWRFHGGLHLDDQKELSAQTPLAKAELPARLLVPLQQHIGEITEPQVKVGDRVLKGQMIAQSEDFIGAPIHASASGRVMAIGAFPVPHPSGLNAPCIVIEPDGEEQWCDLPDGMGDYRNLDPSLLRERIRSAGIVGMGGAAFPTSVKLTPRADQPVKTLILNGAECEPYITCDDVLMRERADKIIAGMEIIQHLVGAQRCLLGVEDNKPGAVQALRLAVQERGLTRAHVVPIPTLYPSGGEKQLIHILTGQEVPSHGLPAQIGVICQNVATAAAVADAVLHGRPLISRIVTVTGRGVKAPGNLETLIGTPASNLINQCGGYTDQAKQLILGGPMMGFSLRSDEVPITKAANCLLVATPEEAPVPEPAQPCIRCGECARVCPVRLLPQQMYWHARAKDLEKVQDYNLFDCIECGCCAHVCPSHIPLVQYYRFAKTEIWAQEQDKRRSDHARERHEARVARLDRLAQERKARLSSKKADLGKSADGKKGAETDKKAAIEAAMRRVAEKKASQSVKPRNTENLTEAQRKQMAKADARRRSNREGRDEQTDSVTSKR